MYDHMYDSYFWPVLVSVPPPCIFFTPKFLLFLHQNFWFFLHQNKVIVVYWKNLIVEKTKFDENLTYKFLTVNPTLKIKHKILILIYFLFVIQF